MGKKTKIWENASRAANLGRQVWACQPWGTTEGLGEGKAILLWERLTQEDLHHRQFPVGTWHSHPNMALYLCPPAASPRSLAFKIFCSCCRDSDESSSTDDSSISCQIQDQQSSRYQTRCQASLDLVLRTPLLLRYPQISFSF